MKNLFSHYTGSGYIPDSAATVIYSCIVVLCIVMIVSWWKIFTKAGEKGWKSLIPFYDFYIACKISTKKSNFWIEIIAVVLAFTFNFLYVAKCGIPRSFCMGVCALAVFVLYFVWMIINIDMAKSFNKKSAFTVFLIVFPIFAYPVLAFGSSKYVGNVAEK